MGVIFMAFLATLWGMVNAVFWILLIGGFIMVIFIMFFAGKAKVSEVKIKGAAKLEGMRDRTIIQEEHKTKKLANELGTIKSIDLFDGGDGRE